MAKQTKAQKARTGVTQDLLPFTDAIKLARKTPSRSSTNPWKSPSTWASIPVTPTSRSAAW